MRDITAPLWQGVFARAGRRFGMRYTVRGVDPDFRAAAGFISRTGVASGNFNHQVITYGKPGSALERWSSDVVIDGTWQYDELMAGRASQDRKLHFNNNFTLRGGWRVGGSVLFETFGYDKPLYADYFLGKPAARRHRVHPVSRRARGCRISITCSRPPRRSAPGSSSMRWCCGARTRISTSGRRPTSSS